MFMVLMEQFLMLESPDALVLITLHLESSETLLSVRLAATILPEIPALKAYWKSQLWGKKKLSFTLVSFDWSNNQINMRQISKRKQIYIHM